MKYPWIYLQKDEIEEKMSSHTVMKGVCQKIPIRIPSAVVCGILIPMQGECFCGGVSLNRRLD